MTSHTRNNQIQQSDIVCVDWLSSSLIRVIRIALNFPEIEKKSVKFLFFISFLWRVFNTSCCQRWHFECASTIDRNFLTAVLYFGVCKGRFQSWNSVYDIKAAPQTTSFSLISSNFNQT